LLPFYGLSRFRSRACLVSPWIDNGHVHQYLSRNPDADRVLLVKNIHIFNVIADSRISTKVLDVTEGIRYLHKEGVIHGDLKGVSYPIPGI